MGNVTLFTIPKAWNKKIGPLQHRALENWREKFPDSSILMFGNDEGTAEAARKYSCAHVPKVEKSSSGAPMLWPIFKEAYVRSLTDIVLYINTDILLTGPVMDVVSALEKRKSFLAIGERKNLDPAIWSENDSEDQMIDKCRTANRYGIDYFLHTKWLYKSMPSFRLGRCWWDNFLVGEAMRLGADMIELSPSIMAVHQEHDYTHAGGYAAVWEGHDSVMNKWLLLTAGLPKPKNGGHSIDDTKYKILTDPIRVKRKWFS